MKYAIQFFVGSKYGMWATGAERFPTMQQAQRHIDNCYWREKGTDITPIYRRPIAVAEAVGMAA